MDEDNEKQPSSLHDTSYHGLIRWSIGACGVLLFFAITFVIFGRLDSPLHLINPQHDADGFDTMGCGNSTQEARDASCLYDVMAAAWVPRPCYQAAVADRYLAMHPWKFYADAEGTSEIPLQSVKNGDYNHMWTSNAFHVAHCLYAWERYLIAVDENLPFDSQAKVAHHAQHCSMFAMNENITREAVQTEIKIAYFSCFGTQHRPNGS